MIVTVPSGPNGETLTALFNSNSSGTGGGDQCNVVLYFKGGSTYAGGNLSITADVTTRWNGGVIKVLDGEYDATTPISTATTPRESRWARKRTWKDPP